MAQKSRRGWFGDHRRHVLAGKGVSTVLPDGRRLDVSKFIAGGESTGSGWGDFNRGETVLNIDGLRKYDILLNHSNQFDSKNVVRVLSVDYERGLFRGEFVDPSNIGELRLPSDKPFVVWDFELKDGEYYRLFAEFHRQMWRTKDDEER
ncbi:MAG: hypothetical protein ACTSPB_00755 [Candidatus Thorarchaeota archaeon]